MEAILKFDMEKPEDRRLHAIMMQAESLHMLTWTILWNELRSLIKHENLAIFDASDREYLEDTDGKPLGADTPIEKISGDTMAELIRSYLFRRMNEENIDLEL